MGDAGSAFARLIRETRRRRGWSQEYLADLSDLGRRTISRWETGDVTEPEAQQVMAVADALGISRLAAFRALGWLDNDPPMGEPERDPVSEELLELRGAVVAVLKRVDDYLHSQHVERK